MKRAMRHLHPGEILGEDVIAASNLTIIDAAILLGIPKQALDKIVNKQDDITPNIALKIAKAFGGTAEIWLSLQSNFNADLNAPE